MFLTLVFASIGFLASCKKQTKKTKSVAAKKIDIAGYPDKALAKAIV